MLERRMGWGVRGENVWREGCRQAGCGPPQGEPPTGLGQETGAPERPWELVQSNNTPEEALRHSVAFPFLLSKEFSDPTGQDPYL